MKMPGRDKNPTEMGTLPNGSTGGTELPMSNKSMSPGYEFGKSADGKSDAEIAQGYCKEGSARSGADDGMKRPPSSDQ
jgi:hypothetical protein